MLYKPFNMMYRDYSAKLDTIKYRILFENVIFYYQHTKKHLKFKYEYYNLTYDRLISEIY